MRKVAIRKALPHIDETDFDINDIKSIRMLPSTHLPTVSKPLPWNTAQSSIGWENRIREEIDEGNLERIPLPTSELGGVGAEGTWVSPALQEAFATPDVTINPEVASTIVGILNGVPNWWRTPRQGSRAGGVGEGFHFGGFPQDSFVRLTDTDINPRSIERALSPLAAETPFRNRVRNLVSQFPSYEEEGVSPEQAASLVWGKQPTNLTVNPLQDKTGGATKIASEPMDIAFQLLKEDIDYQDEDYIHPHEQIWNDEADEQLVDTTNSLWDYVENMSNDDKIEWLRLQGNPFMQRGMQRMYGDFPELNQQDIDDSIWEMMFDAWQDSQMEMPDGIDFDLGGNRKIEQTRDPTRAYAVHPNHWKKLASEPMDIAFQLLKERVSPEAKRHKLEYDKKYESSPERIKYREQLNQERRKRGIYGSHDHKDISHTEGGKLTLEGEHENRARHFREKGTLRPN